MSRLADIYKSEKKSGGGILSTVGKRALEKIDPRQLFDQSGMLAAMAPTLFKKYSATSMKKEKLALSPTPQAPLQDAKMDLIIKQNQDVITNTKISAKNSLMFPGMARDMNVMRQNMVKMVKLQGGTAATKADMFFKTSKEREAEYEVKFQKDRPASPTPAGGKNKPEGKGGLLGLFSGIAGAISGLGGVILKGITSALSIENLMKVFGVAGSFISGFAKLLPMLISPTFLGIVAAIAGATWLMKFLQSKNDEANTEEKKNERIAADRGSQASKLAARTILINNDLKSLLAADRTDQDVSDYTRGEIKTKDELAKAISSAEKSGKKSIEIQDSRVAAEARQNLNPPASYNPAKDSQAASAAADLAATPNESAAETQRLMSKKPVQVSSAPSRAPTATQTNGVELLNRAMDKEGITDPIVRDRVSQLAMVESSMNPAAKGPVIPSGMHKGDQAQGLLQIMPKTAEGLGFSREQISDPETAAIAGVRYFKMNLKRFNDNLDAATVAHHSGPGGAKRWLESGSAGTKDLATGLSTDNYLTKVAGSPTLAPSMATLAAAPPMATLAAATPTRPSSIISDSTVALAEVKERTSSAPIVVNAPQTVNNMQQGSQAVTQYTAPSIVDSEFMRMLVSRAV